MDKDSTTVEVFLKSQVEQAGEVHNLDEHYFGVITKIGDDLRLQYSESDDQSKLITFSFYENGIIRLQRKGDPEMDFIFDQDKEYLAGTYNTLDAGQMNIQVKTSKQNFSIEDSNQKGEATIEYQLINGEMGFGNFSLNLSFQPV